jgi:hypothetical protein
MADGASDANDSDTDMREEEKQDNDHEEEKEDNEHEEEQEGELPDREWQRVSKATEVRFRRVVGDRAEKQAEEKRATDELAKFTFTRAIAAEFWRSALGDMIKNFSGELQEEAPDATVSITVMEAASYTAVNDESNAQEKEYVRCAKSFMGAKWQDGVMLIVRHEKAGQLRNHSVNTKPGLQIAYYPNCKRIFGIVQLIFSYQGKLWLLVEKLEGATKSPKFGRLWGLFFCVRRLVFQDNNFCVGKPAYSA